MTFGSMVGVLLTLGFVLALLGLALKLLKRFAPVATGSARLRMEIVQRLALGPKQGIAVIRVGERIVAVSVGEGGVNRLFELESNELRDAAEAAHDAGERSETRPNSPLDFRSALKGALKTAGLVVAFALVSLPTSHVARAQTASAKAPAAMVQKLASSASLKAAAPAGPAGIPNLDLRVGNGDGLHLSGTVGVVVMMGMLTLLPTLLLMMTGFTRILIVLNFLRQALGTQSVPPTQLVAALALLLTGFVMAPTLSEFNRTALTPWMDGQIDQSQMMQIGAKPFRAFMLRQTRRNDLETFVRMGGGPQPATVGDVPLVTLTSAFVISELRTAFQIGFALFLPFIVIDVAVSSVLMSMGMFMLPPAMISLPFKLLLFVLVDGWSLIVQSLITSFK